MTLRQRDPRVRDKAHLGKVARLPCLACLIRRGAVVRPVEVCHIKIGYPEAGWRAFGHAEKAHDWRTIGMCRNCHREGANAQHQNRGGDERWFWAQLAIYPPDLCAALVDAFAAGATGESVLLRFADKARAEIADRDLIIV